MTTTDPEGPALLDVNVLLALAWDQHVHHGAAHRHFPSVAKSWATTALTESALIRLLLTPAVVGRPVGAAEALGLLRDLRAVSGWQWIADDASFAESVIDLRVLVGRRQVTDLHLVDLAARNGLVLVTFDSGIRSSLANRDQRHVEVWSA